jgi:hypothetical protein
VRKDRPCRGPPHVRGGGSGTRWRGSLRWRASGGGCRALADLAPAGTPSEREEGERRDLVQIRLHLTEARHDISMEADGLQTAHGDHGWSRSGASSHEARGSSKGLGGEIWLRGDHVVKSGSAVDGRPAGGDHHEVDLIEELQDVEVDSAEGEGRGSEEKQLQRERIDQRGV